MRARHGRARDLDPAHGQAGGHEGISQSDEEPDDRRDVQRTKVLRNAKIIVPRRSSIIHCTVQNITSGGACLKLANTYGVPETFELTFEHGRTRRACRVVWRTNDELGVAFEEAETRGGKSIRTPPRRAMSRSMSSGRDSR